jgi:hypothetical protein
MASTPLGRQKNIWLLKAFRFEFKPVSGFLVSLSLCL